MDNREDHGKNHSSGNDGPVVHICHKCGWPFPNPHPSARHRRAHKKICGTIEGYKVFDSRGCSALSDDEHLSDEDHKTPSRQVFERSNDEIKSGGSGERTNRSEDDAFVDAVTEFSDSGSAKGIERYSDDVIKGVRSIETSSMNDMKTALLFDDDAITAVVPPSIGSADSSQDAESQGNTPSADAIDSESQPSHVTVGSMERSITDCRTEEFIDDKHSSVCDLNPIQLESQGNLKKRAWEDLSVIDVMENKDHNKKRNAVDDLMVTDTKGKEKAIETSEATLDHVASVGVIESNEQYNDELSLNVPSSEADFIGSTTQIKVPDIGEMASKGSGKLTEIVNEVGEVNDNFHVLSFPDDVPKLGNPEIIIEGYKDHRAGRMPQLIDEVLSNPSNPFSSLTVGGGKLFASKDNIPQCQPLMCDTQEGGNSGHVNDSVLRVGLDGKVEVNDVEKSSNVQCPQEQPISLELEMGSKSVAAEVLQASESADYDTTESEEVNEIADDRCRKMTVTPENHGILSQGEVHEKIDFPEDGNDKVGRGGDSSLGSVDGSGSTSIPEIAKNMVTSEINLSEPESLILNKASDSQQQGPDDKGDVAASVGDSDEIFKSLDVQILPKPSEVLHKSPEDQITNLSPSIQNSAAIVDDPAKGSVEAGPENQTDECENKIATQQLGAYTTTDFSVDSGSQTDSLEAHWGSVSVLSTQSDMQATAGERADMEKQKTEGAQQNEKSDMFEPPSFMTLVEPTKGDMAADEIQRAQKEAQAGWFPSLTNVVNESQGRKKNEEMIAKVTNWTATKQHAPLKNLLTESNTENKSKQNQPLPEPVKKDDAAKEWNSPARYPADIKREKRKVKGRPYWAQFMCCSSVN